MNNKKLLASSTLVIFGTALLLTQFLGQNAQAILVKKTIIDKQMELSGLQGKFVTFTIPKGVSDVYLSGKTKVVGGVLTHILIALYYAKNCPATGATVNFLQCKAYTW